MKTQDMIKLFHEYLDTASDTFKNIDRPVTDTILRYLNEAYILVVSEYCTGPTFPESVLKAQANTEVLRKLIQEQVLVPLVAVAGQSGRYTADISTTTKLFGYYLRGKSNCTRTALPVTSRSFVELKPIHDHEVHALISTVYNKPIIREPGITFSKDLLNIYADTRSIVEDLYLTYVQVPDELTLEITSECLLSSLDTCYLVVRKATEQFLITKGAFAERNKRAREEQEKQAENIES